MMYYSLPCSILSTLINSQILPWVGHFTGRDEFYWSSDEKTTFLFIVNMLNIRADDQSTPNFYLHAPSGTLKRTCSININMNFVTLQEFIEVHHLNCVVSNYRWSNNIIATTSSTAWHGYIVAVGTWISSMIGSATSACFFFVFFKCTRRKQALHAQLCYRKDRKVQLQMQTSAL